MHRPAVAPSLLAVVVAVALAAVAATSPAALAQTPPPDSCPLPPVTLPLFDATPAAVIVATPANPVSRPAADEGSITQALQSIVACANSTSQAERYAVFTDRYLASLFTSDSPADQPAFERMIETGQVPSPGTATLDAATDIVQRDDGRVEVTMHITTATGAVTDRVILAWDESAQAWLIDGIVSLDPPA